LADIEDVERRFTYVGFRIYAPELKPNLVSELLGLEPTHTHLRGDYRHNNPKYTPYKHGMWSLGSKLTAAEPLSEHLESLLAVLEPKREQLLKLSEENEVDFFCSLFSQGGLWLSADLLRRIADLGADLSADIYPPDDADPEVDKKAASDRV
jgi:hypothetical protein